MHSFLHSHLSSNVVINGFKKEHFATGRLVAVSDKRFAISFGDEIVHYPISRVHEVHEIENGKAFYMAAVGGGYQRVYSDSGDNEHLVQIAIIISHEF